MKLSRTRNRKRESSIDVTPLLDAAFILIIFLLVTTAFKTEQNAFELQLPTASSNEVVVRPSACVIEINSEGMLALSVRGPDSGGAAAETVTPQELGKRLRPILEEDPGISVQFRVDEGTPYKVLVGAMDAAQQAGAKNIQLPFSPPSAEPEKN